MNKQYPDPWPEDAIEAVEHWQSVAEKWRNLYRKLEQVHTRTKRMLKQMRDIHSQFCQRYYHSIVRNLTQDEMLTPEQKELFDVDPFKKRG